MKISSQISKPRLLQHQVSPQKKTPKEPKNPEEKELFQTIKKFVEDDSITEFDFPPALNNNQRKIVHSLAENFGLEHYSRGSKVRYITIEKQANKKQDEWQYFGYIGLFGPSINASVDAGISEVPQEMIQNRIKRDGPISHITLLSSEEAIALLLKVDLFKAHYGHIFSEEKYQTEKEEAVMDVISDVIIDDWMDLGLGKVVQSKNEVWFKVLDWNSAASFRQNMGFPQKDFHITVGYALHDIHNTRKDKSALVQS